MKQLFSIFEKFSNNQNLLFIIILSSIFKITYIFFNEVNLFLPNLGGDVCYHLNVANNFANTNRPTTDFIISYWHIHDTIPALIDLYPPAFYIFTGSLMKFFGNSYLSARFIIFLLSILSLVLFFKTMEKIFKKNLVFFSTIFFSLNIFYLQHSVIFMSIMFYMLIIQIFVFFCVNINNFFISNKYKFIILFGLFNSLASISFNGWEVIFIFSLILILLNFYKFYINKKLLLISLFLIFCLPLYLWWGFYTKEYFGEFHYSNLKKAIYHPDGWIASLRMDSLMPEENMINYLLRLNFIEYIPKFFFRSLIAFERISDSFFPFLIGIKKVFNLNIFFFPITIFIFIYGAIKTRNYGIFLLLFFIILFAAFCFGWRIGIDKDIEYIISYRYGLYFFPIGYIFLFKLIEKNINAHYFNLMICFYIVFSAIILFNFKPLSSRDIKDHYEFGEKINKLTNHNDVIIYPFNVPDLYCISKRKGITDSTSETNNNDKLLKFAKKYKASFLYLDFSNNIYQKDPKNDYVKNLENIINLYKPLNPKIIYKDDNKKMYLLKLNYN